MTTRGGARQAGRKRRKAPKSKPIWCGQMSETDRQYILANTTPAQRYHALLVEATRNYENITDT